MKDAGMCGSLISLAKFATDLRKLKTYLALTCSSLDWHGLIQMEFLLQKFWIQCQLPVVFMSMSCHYLNFQICNKKASEGVSSAVSPVAAGLIVPLEVGERVSCLPEASSGDAVKLNPGSVSHALLCGFLGAGMDWELGELSYSVFVLDQISVKGTFFVITLERWCF